MGRTCAWCGTVMRTTVEASIPASHALCSGCLEELQSALSANGLKQAPARPRRR